jgi:hypothetical protein
VPWLVQRGYQRGGLYSIDCSIDCLGFWTVRGDAMFVGHFGVALAAKRLAPRASLAVLILAAQLADVMWPVLVALGIEQVRINPGNTAFTPLDFVAYPYSHSLLLLVVWGLVLGVLTRAHVGGRAAIPLIAGVVVSHWVLDWITHRPDMPLFPGGPRLGLGLWNSVPVDARRRARDVCRGYVDLRRNHARQGCRRPLGLRRGWPRKGTPARASKPPSADDSPAWLSATRTAPLAILFFELAGTISGTILGQQGSL